MKLLVTAILAALLGWLVFLLLRPITILLGEPQSVSASQMRQVGGTPAGGLLLSGWAERNRIDPGERLETFYRLSNVGTEGLTGIKLGLHGAGFRVVSVSGCLAPGGANVATGDFDLAPLDPGISCSLRLAAQASRDPGEYMLSAGFSWTVPLKGARFEVLDLGPLRVRSRQRERVATLFALILQLTPIGVPLLVAVAGFWFQGRQQHNTQVRQAWAAMVPVSHQNNMELYLPLLSRIRTFGHSLKGLLEENRKSDAEAEDSELTRYREPLFQLLQSLSCMRRITLEGGFYFQRRKGEVLVRDLWSSFFDTLLKKLDPERSGRLGAALDGIDTVESYSAYLRKQGARETQFDLRRSTASATGALTPKKAADDLLPYFRSWVLATGDGDFQDWFLLSKVVGLEMNRIYSFWYVDGVGGLRRKDLERVQRDANADRIDEIELRERLQEWIDRHLTWRDCLDDKGWWRRKFRLGPKAASVPPPPPTKPGLNSGPPATVLPEAPDATSPAQEKHP